MDKNELEEGHLYTVKNGVIHEIQTDPDDTMVKVRITDDAMNAVKEVQKALRKQMNGYKPDISVVASSLIESASKKEDIEDVVRQYALNLFSK